MVIFYSYVSLPEGTPTEQLQFLRKNDEYHYNLSVLNAEKWW